MKKLAEVPFNSNFLCFGHNGEPARSRMKVSSPFLLMRRRTNQSGESSFHEISLNAANSHERVRHRGSASVEAVRRVRRRHHVAHLLVEAAPEGARMGGRGTHARALRLVVRVVALSRGRDGAVRRNRTVQREPHGASGEVDTCRRRGTVKEVCGTREA